MRSDRRCSKFLEWSNPTRSNSQASSPNRTKRQTYLLHYPDRRMPFRLALWARRRSWSRSWAGSSRPRPPSTRWRSCWTDAALSGTTVLSLQWSHGGPHRRETFARRVFSRAGVPASSNASLLRWSALAKPGRLAKARAARGQQKRTVILPGLAKTGRLDPREHVPPDIA